MINRLSDKSRSAGSTVAHYTNSFETQEKGDRIVDEDDDEQASYILGTSYNGQERGTVKAPWKRPGDRNNSKR